MECSTGFLSALHARQVLYCAAAAAAAANSTNRGANYIPLLGLGGYHWSSPQIITDDRYLSSSFIYPLSSSLLSFSTPLLITSQQINPGRGRHLPSAAHGGSKSLRGRLHLVKLTFVDGIQVMGLSHGATLSQRCSGPDGFLPGHVMAAVACKLASHECKHPIGCQAAGRTHAFTVLLVYIHPHICDIYNYITTD